MLGDFFSPTAQLRYDACCGYQATALADIPLAAGGRRMKISENNKALPMDRIYFNFNHFHNVVDTTPDVGAFFAGRSGRRLQLKKMEAIPSSLKALSVMRFWWRIARLIGIGA